MEFGSIIKTVAPWIATALGGPLGGMAITAAADALGISDKTESAIKAALSGATPEQMLALKNADNDFAAKMQALGFENLETMTKLENEDRADARHREIETSDLTPKILAFVITGGFFGMLLAMLYNAIPDANRDILNIMLGALGTTWASVMAYYFGSTKGSAEKTRLIAAGAPVK